MKLILIPGMDGTGRLFDGLLAYLHNVDVQVIPLPESGEQCYEVLAAYVMKRLPIDEDFTLLVESFSGPIGILIAQSKPACLRKMIVVASFTEALVLTRIPLSGMAATCARYMPSISYMWLYGQYSWVQALKAVVQSLPKKLLAQRVKSIASLRLKPVRLELPLLYLRPSNDRLVSKKQADRWALFFPNIRYVQIDGPHFIAQASPERCAEAILHHCK